MTKSRYDSLIIRCPSLGGEVPFRYCRNMNEGFPCRRLPVCWSEKIDIFGFIKRFYSTEEIDRFFVCTGPGRLDQIFYNLERIERMKKEEMNKDELIEAIRKEAVDGKMTCAKAWLLAEKFDCPKLEMGMLLNKLKIKLIKCQLGCF